MQLRASKPAVHVVDTIAAMSAELMKALDEHGKFMGLRGRSSNITSAFRQLPMSDNSLPRAKIAVL